MFGIDFSEILVIFGIALVVLGPEKLPRLAQQIGRWVGRARAMARQFREQLEQETDTLRRAGEMQSRATPPQRPTAPSSTPSTPSTPPSTHPAAGEPKPVDTAPDSHEQR